MGWLRFSKPHPRLLFILLLPSLGAKADCSADSFCVQALFPCEFPQKVTRALEYCATATQPQATDYPDWALNSCRSNGNGKQEIIDACECGPDCVGTALPILTITDTVTGTEFVTTCTDMPSIPSSGETTSSTEMPHTHKTRHQPDNLVTITKNGTTTSATRTKTRTGTRSSTRTFAPPDTITITHSHNTTTTKTPTTHSSSNVTSSTTSRSHGHGHGHSHSHTLTRTSSIPHSSFSPHPSPTPHSPTSKTRTRTKTTSSSSSSSTTITTTTTKTPTPTPPTSSSSTSTSSGTNPPPPGATCTPYPQNPDSYLPNPNFESGLPDWNIDRIDPFGTSWEIALSLPSSSSFSSPTTTTFYRSSCAAFHATLSRQVDLSDDLTANLRLGSGTLFVPRYSSFADGGGGAGEQQQQQQKDHGTTKKSAAAAAAKFRISYGLSYIPGRSSNNGDGSSSSSSSSSEVSLVANGETIMVVDAWEAWARQNWGSDSVDGSEGRGWAGYEVVWEVEDDGGDDGDFWVGMATLELGFNFVLGGGSGGMDFSRRGEEEEEEEEEGAQWWLGGVEIVEIE